APCPGKIMSFQIGNCISCCEISEVYAGDHAGKGMDRLSNVDYLGPKKPKAGNQALGNEQVEIML
ncbi:MAG: hypothetical protein RBQ69_09405, partial [Candidatus Cloacimonadaceae bacterium]|nr:hypothetical protein [Candidatus Cloacimonadota bacterium]MDY0338092.1 hypothetical protein [Candidatus Cloacimonadaceae bacterium]